MRCSTPESFLACFASVPRSLEDARNHKALSAMESCLAGAAAYAYIPNFPIDCLLVQEAFVDQGINDPRLVTVGFAGWMAYVAWYETNTRYLAIGQDIPRVLLHAQPQPFLPDYQKRHNGRVISRTPWVEEPVLFGEVHKKIADLLLSPWNKEAHQKLSEGAYFAEIRAERAVR